MPLLSDDFITACSSCNQKEFFPYHLLIYAGLNTVPMESLSLAVLLNPAVQVKLSVKQKKQLFTGLVILCNFKPLSCYSVPIGSRGLGENYEKAIALLPKI